MFACAHCHGLLAREKSSQGIFWDCPSCSGRLSSISLLRKVSMRDVTNQIWRKMSLIALIVLALILIGVVLAILMKE